MAITKTMHMKASGKGKIDVRLEHAINYILQPKKLGNCFSKHLLSCFHLLIGSIWQAINTACQIGYL